MTRFAIDRKNRDRKGGHEHTPIRKGHWAGADMKVARSVIKRYDKRLLRRQHSKAINEGMALLAQEQEDRQAAYWGVQDSLDDDSTYNLDWMNEHDDEIFDDYLDDSSYFDDFDDRPYYPDEVYCGDPDCIQCSEGRSYRPRSNARVQDQIVAQQLTDEVRRGMVSLTLEVIENKDAGKSLGQLLRERLSRPF